MARIGVITNPYSGLNKNGEVNLAALDDLVSNRGFHIKTESEGDIPLAVDEVKNQEIDIVAINSGDGGNHRIITELMYAFHDKDKMPLLVTLRGGTINFVAAALGFHGSNIIRRHVLFQSPPEQILERVVSDYGHMSRELLPSVERKVLHVTTRDEEGNDMELYGFVFANGVVTNFLQEYYDMDALISEPGKAKFFEVFIKTLASIPARYASTRAEAYYDNMTRRQKISIEVDGEMLPLEQVIGIAAASMDLSIDLGPLSLRPFYKINGAPRVFQIIGGDVPIPTVIANLPNLFAGRPIKAQGYFDRKVRRVVLRTDEEQQGFTIDGDVYTSTGPITIDAQRKLRFLAKSTPYY